MLIRLKREMRTKIRSTERCGPLSEVQTTVERVKQRSGVQRDADQDQEYREMQTKTRSTDSQATIRSTDYSRKSQTTIRRTERCRPRLGVQRVKPR